MKKMLVSAALFLFMINGAVVQGASKVNASLPPKVFQTVGDTTATYEPTRWPDFYKYSSDNPSCGEWLKTHLSLKKKAETHPECFSFSYRTVLSKMIDFNKDIGEIYKKTAKIIVTWSVRIEAEKVVINPWSVVCGSHLCSPWHGTSYQRFYKGKSGGDAYATLFINGERRKETATMTFPPLGEETSINSMDPTVTGSAVLTADDFEGEFPDKLTFEIKWMNDTYGGKIVSPRYTRSMAITVLPQGK